LRTGFGAAARRLLFAQLAWLCDYQLVLDLEAAAEGATIAELTRRFTSTYARRAMSASTDAAQRTCTAVASRMRERGHPFEPLA